MKSLKKTLVLLVVFSMILSTLVPAFAATDVADLDCEDQVTRMEALGVITGFEDGTFRPNETITRAQMAVIICKMLGINEASAKANESVASKFSDVAANEWYTGWINIASNNGVIAGFPDGTFRPNETLTLNQVLTLCVKALGRGGYVDKMGTWPANYVTEAARLNLLKDVKGASDANRGTVAVICWNTLNAATWYVDSENLDGEVSLGHDSRTLLAINFSEFTDKAGDLKEIEDVVMVKAENRQLTLNASDVEFANEFENTPKKNKDEKSYKTTKIETVDSKEVTVLDKVIIYVPEDVCEDLDSLKNKTLTIVLGDDNVAALIVVEDDVVDTDFLTKYADNKITVADEEYKLAKGFKVVLNGANLGEQKDAEGTEVTGTTCSDCGALVGKTHELDCEETGAVTPAVDPLDNALRAIFGGAYDNKDIEKKIETTLILDEDDKVISIELFTSAELANTKEVLVTKVKETKSVYTIYTTDKNISWDIDDEDELDFPKVYINGNIADIRDIEAGNVLTIITDSESKNDIYYNNDNTKVISKIYASNNVVTGEATKVKKANNAITLDGEVYTATNAATANKMSTEELKDNEFTKTFDAQTVLDNEEVTLYLNIFGEYVAITLEEANTDYTFGVVTFVSSNITWAGDDEEIAVRNFKVLLPDGTKKTYKLTVNTDDDDITTANKNKVQEDENVPFTTGNFVMFEANSNNEVVIEDGDEITVLTSSVAAGKIGTTDYVLDYAVANSVDKDDAEFKFATNKDGEYDANTTVIFNIAEKEIVSKWKSIVVDGSSAGKYSLAANTFMIFEDDDEDIPMFIVVNIPEENYSSSDAVYALVDNGTYKEGNEFYVDFVGNSGIEVKENQPANTLTDIEGWLVEYAMSASKISEAYKLINVNEFQGKDVKDSTLLSTLISVTAKSKDVAATTDVKDSADKIVSVTVDADTFETAVTNAGTYEFVYDGTTDNRWEDSTGAEANLTTYGITLGTGATAVDTNKITVTLKIYEADTVIAYNDSEGATRTAVEQIELDEVKVSSSGKITLKFVKTDVDSSNKDTAIGDVKLDKDEITVYDLRDGSIEKIDIEDVKTEVEDGASVYVVPAHNSDWDSTAGQNLLFIVK